ncbi:MAG: phosphoribosylamine--glycine ligase [Thermoplasmata archaeon HGW-Thermoplasmata-1]|nr:MAG: phosphoribosylamine--glycine ligase [Thermoplasmata archaeon HGW-Thermoplasmata-1]
MKVLVVGGGAREHAICKAVARSKDAELYCAMKNLNPGIVRLAKNHLLTNETDVSKIVDYAKKKSICLAIIGPESAEEAGIVDELKKAGIPAASPTKGAALIETDKEFMRKLMKKHKISGRLGAESFSDPAKAREFIEKNDLNVAIKPLGLTGGKGVRVGGDHFTDIEGAMGYVNEVLSNSIGGKSKVLIEEKAAGEEFTIQAFSDGKTTLPMPSVQDHKRLLPGDNGPNTGGMGSYSQADGLLPFMSKSDYEEAATIIQTIVESLADEGTPYVGTIYGQFMLTTNGPKVIEINARFGDPEAMNVLSLLETDYIEICKAMVEGTLHEKNVSFKKQATVCKYVVPEGYGVKSMEDVLIEVDEKAVADAGAEIFYASVNERGGQIYTTSSRALAVVGVADTIDEAEVICEKGLANVKSEHIFIRHDIGGKELIQKRINNINSLRGN